MKCFLWLAIALYALHGLAGCGGNIQDPQALACADVVKHYLGLQGGVVVTEAVENSAGDGLEIAYEGTNGENIPVEGVADCSFAGATRRVIAARVGNRRVPAEALGAGD